MDVDRLRRDLANASTTQAVGRVVAVTGLCLRASLPGARVGDLIRVRARGRELYAEVAGFEGGEVVALPVGSLFGIGPDDVVEAAGGPLSVALGTGLLGSVLDGLGRTLSGGVGPLDDRRTASQSAPSALSRRPVTEPFGTGVRVIDGLITLGVGQRVGLFSGSGVGKSTLLGTLARGAESDVVVVALVGERGREVGEFIDRNLGAARERSVVVAATSDAPAVERLRAAEVATTVAEYFREQGKRVLLLVDSITRVARAQRDVGLAAGEIPARRGFPPSVFSMLPRLLERTGQSDVGSITAVYTVLVEGDDLDEPVADEVRGLVDGHIVLSRSLAERGWFPAVDVPASVSRVRSRVTASEHQADAAAVRSAIALYEHKRDLMALGGYKKGQDPALDRAVAALPKIESYCRQDPDARVELGDAIAGLGDVARLLSEPSGI